jgi:carboxylesterase type B
LVAKIAKLGPLGWLGGPIIKNTPGAVANAGLYDQRAVFQWIQTNIHLVNGDPSNVSAWGESAGSGSILHHLIAKSGTLDPLFHRAVLMSPGFVPQWDNSRYGKILLDHGILTF